MKAIINSAPNIELGFPPNALTFVERYYPEISCPDLIKVDALFELYESNRIPNEFQMCGSEELLASEYNGDIRNPKIETDLNKLLRVVYERSILACVETEVEFQQLRVSS